MMMKSRRISLRGAGQRSAARNRSLHYVRTRRSDGPQPRKFWFPVICGVAILTIGIGARQSLGLFQKPIAAARKVGRELWSLANALAMLLMGAFSPLLGNIADRFGTAHTVATGGLFYVAGMFMTAFATAGLV